MSDTMERLADRMGSGGLVPDDERHLGIEFAPADGGGLVVSDPIERSQFELSTPEPVELADADPGRFRFPADAAVRLRTDQLRLETVVSVCVRNDDGDLLARTEHFDDRSFDDGTYSVELFAPIKLYLRVDAPLRVVSDATCTRIEFDGETDVTVGARSHHKRPAATITTTDRPQDAMRAVSLLGSALKTTSVERSYPTLRGHPPLVERGDTFEAPAGLSPPETGATLELPETRRHVYTAAPLSYYLGATVVPGSTPRLVTDEGFAYELGADGDFEGDVERLLKRTFFLDCLTRTEGFYQVDLHERTAFESDLPAGVDLDFADLYGRSSGAQLEAYLDVPYRTIEAHAPTWKRTAHVAPTASNAELLPFLANDLVTVTTPTTEPTTGSATQADAVEGFLRRPSAPAAGPAPIPGPDAAPDTEAFTRSTDTYSGEAGADRTRTYVRPPETDALEQAWVGPGIPIGASKASGAAYRNRLSRDPVEGDIGITVVCNDPRMAAERDAVEAVYGSRESLPFDVRTYYELPAASLREVLKADTEFLHYIGHIDSEGFECPDGALDVGTVESVGVDSFLLNACQSYEQGMELIERGAIAGIVTLSDVINDGAVDIGRSLARLLNYGFPIRPSLEIAGRDTYVGDDYIVVGDGSFHVTQVQGALPNLCEITDAGGSYQVEYITYPVGEFGLGSLVRPILGEDVSHYLSSGTADIFEMTESELEDFLSLEDIPVVVNGQLFWSGSLDLDSI
jgi:hypothetical protein